MSAITGVWSEIRGFKPRGRDCARWLVPALLALPFVLVIAATGGLTSSLHTFHWSDEIQFHYPTILRFAHQWPAIDLVHYPAAQTPLFHVLMATLAQVVGLEIWRLRIAEVLISYLGALVLFRLLHECRGLERRAALTLSALVVLSPYVFGASFILDTDNLALVLVIATVYELERFRARPAAGPFALASLAAGCAALSRQSTVFLFLIAFGYLAVWGRSLPVRVRGWLLGLFVVALAPLLALVSAWHGLVPIGSDPASCGLCGAGTGRTATTGAGLFLRSVSFTLAVSGVYAGVLFGPRLLASWRAEGSLATQLRGLLPTAAGAGAAAGVLLLADPLHRLVGDGGWLWRVASSTPSLLGSLGLFWVLAPLGAGALALRWRSAPGDWLGPMFMLSFCLVALATRLGWQKYYDPYALLAVVLTVRRGELSRASYVGAGILIAGSLLYALGFAVGYVK